jgi:hypothetical protein
MIYASLYENRFRILRQNQILASYGAVLQRKPRKVISTSEKPVKQFILFTCINANSIATPDEFLISVIMVLSI